MVKKNILKYKLKKELIKLLSDILELDVIDIKIIEVTDQFACITEYYSGHEKFYDGEYDYYLNGKNGSDKIYELAKKYYDLR